MKSGKAGVVLKQVGDLLIILGFIEICPSIVASIYEEWFSAIGFVLSGIFTSSVGYILHKNFYQLKLLTIVRY